MDPWFVEGIAIAVCLLGSALFSASETALTGLPPVRREQLRTRYPRWARSLQLWERDPDGVLATILTCNTVLTIAASALATSVSAQLLTHQALPVAIGVMTFLLLTFGEIGPKTMARRFPEALAPALMNFLVPFYWSLYPLSWMISRIIGWLVKDGQRRPSGHLRLTAEDIAYTLQMGGEHGALDEEHQNLHQAVHEFMNTTAREIMVPRTDMVSISVDSTREELLTLVHHSGFSRIPVYQDSRDRILGVLHTKDLLIPPAVDRGKDQGKEFLHHQMRKAVFVPESMKISDVFKKFQSEHIHMAIVVDEFGGTGGIITLEDVIEELLGEIRDEFDREEDRLVALGPKIWRADARISIGDLEEALGIAFPEERNYESLGGFLTEHFGEVPTLHRACEHGGYCFRVTARTPQRVIRVGIQHLQEEERENSSPETTESAPPAFSQAPQ